MTTLADKDLELWKEWKRNPSEENKAKLLKAMSPIIQREVNKWGGVMPPVVMEMEAKALAVQAFESYDPDRGVKLSTHVTNRLQKVSRTVYTHQNSARISEHKLLQYNTHQTASSALRDHHGREPTVQEMSDELGWSPAKVKQFNAMFERKEYQASEEHPETYDDVYNHRIDFVYHELNPQQKKIFEHTTGYMGKKIMSNEELRKELNISQGQLSYQKRLIIDKMKRVT